LNRLREFVHVEQKLGVKEFARMAFHNAKPGGEFLNVVFGWQPFLRDLVSAMELSNSLDARLKKLRDENGKGIHRRETLERKRSTEDWSRAPTANPWDYVSGVRPSGLDVVGTTTHTATRTWDERVWFAGKYRYWIPDVNSLAWEARAVAALWGAIPTPSLVYELVPMSWLLDWFTNFGDVISNISTNAVDNLVLEYGFIMRHVLVEDRCRVDGFLQGSDLPGYQVWPSQYHSFQSNAKFETKARAGCNPFFPTAQPWVFQPGTASPFSSKQWAILVSLGLSQGFNR